MQRGFITLHRKLVDWEWYTDINVKVLFIHMLLRANHKDKNYRGELIKRGSFTSSLQVLAIETGLTIQQLRTAIKKLEKTNELTCKTTRNYSLYIVENYELYQASNTENNKRATNEQQTSNKRATTNNNDNNVNNDNNDNNVYSEPTIKQIEFAKTLGIDPTGLSKYELSKEIKKASSKSSSYIEPDYEEPNKTITSKIVFDEY